MKNKIIQILNKKVDARICYALLLIVAIIHILILNSKDAILDRFFNNVIEQEIEISILKEKIRLLNQE